MTLFIITLLFIFILAQYSIVIVLLIKQDYFQDKVEFWFHLIPILSVIIFTIITLHQMIFNKEVQDYIKKEYKKLK
jgi:hypothetical protein